MGRQQRRRERRNRDGQPPARTPEGGARVGAPGGRTPRTGWRRTFDQWGGFTVFVPVALAILAVVALIVLNRPGDEGGGEFTPTEREQVAGRIIGDPSAPVRIVEYADFQCVHCAAFAEETEPRLMDQYVQEGIASFEFRHFPVLGPGSVRAAEAAECAGAQDRFWDYHDILFLRQHPSNDFADGRLSDYARELAEHFPDFDVEAFDACLASDETATAVQQMQAEGQALGVQATPTFFVNGEPLRGNQPLEVFQQAIEQARGGG